MVWHIGNTTIRTPYRLKHALKVLDKSNLIGNLGGRFHGGKIKEQEFAELLHYNGVVYVQRIAEEQEKDVSDLGRKWRVALCQLGFITPDKTFDTNFPSFSITPNGRRLIETEMIAGQQECFLRSLAVYQLPNGLEKKYRFNTFSPLRFVLQIIFKLSTVGQDPFISFTEFALFVQTKTDSFGVDQVISNIVEYRKQRLANRGKIKSFKKQLFRDVVGEVYPDATRLDTKERTLRDYADLTLRYLKATGLFKARGRGIVVAPVKQKLAELLAFEDWKSLEKKEYFLTLWEGARLPTDDYNIASNVIDDLVTQINSRGGRANANIEGLNDADVAMERHRLENQLICMEELEFAHEQAEKVPEITTWLDALCSSKRESETPDGELIRIPKGEAAAYLEWAIWRVFLATNSLQNPPWKSRRFQIDQDFLPVGTAPGHGADMIFEFNDIVVVTEVTLTSSSRQEAAEGEPVRRHVAECMKKYADAGKRVYGLFLAVKIDSNTAHTFKHGDWYLSDDTKINLSIVPISLGDFNTLLKNKRTNFADLPQILKCLLLECRAISNLDAPLWKKSISRLVTTC